VPATVPVLGDGIVLPRRRFHFSRWTKDIESDILRLARRASKPDRSAMQEPPPALPPEPTAPPPVATSLVARLMNVFAMPGEVFDEIKAAPSSAANWLVPVFLNCIVGAVAVVILMSQPAILQGIREKQDAQFQKMVQQGKMSQADADKAMAMTEKFTGPTMMKITGVIGSVVVSFMAFFWWTTVLWLLGRWFLRVDFGYIKTMEAAGLASMIGVLGVIVTLLLQVNFSNLTSSPSLGMLVSDFDPKKVSHLALGAVNFFAIWRVIVQSIALARLAGVPFQRSAFVMFPFWLLCQAAMVAVSSLAGRLGG
jgi:Yip1 domain